jgi:hypothetical protein
VKNPILEALISILLDAADGSQFELPTFTAKGNCTKPQVDPDVFYDSNPESVLLAKAICSDCPIIGQCLQWAMKHEEYGVFGGRTPAERKRQNGDKPVLDAQLLQQYTEDLAILLSSQSVEPLVVRYKVTNRTIYRWKRQLTALQQQSNRQPSNRQKVKG